MGARGWGVRVVVDGGRCKGGDSFGGLGLIRV